MSGVSVLVLTYNEEKNIRACLQSVAWSSDIHVVDSGSTDSTVVICREFTPHVQYHSFESFSAQYNWALDHVPFRHEWLLVVEADEVVPEELRDEILRVLELPPSDIAGYYVRWRILFLGRWIKHCTMYNSSWLLRLFRHRQVRYEDRPVNQHAVCRGRCGRLQHGLWHDNRNGPTRLLAKYNRYASWEAEESLRLLRGETVSEIRPRLLGNPSERRRWLKQVFMRLPLRPLLKFFYLYVLSRGFLDGMPGLLYCTLTAVQEFFVGVKVGARKRALPA